MAVLDATSTIAEVEAEYFESASYVEDASVAKARRFITAARILLLRRPRQLTNPQGDSIQLSPDLLAEQIKDASQYLGANDTTAAGKNRSFDLRSFRD